MKIVTYRIAQRMTQWFIQNKFLNQDEYDVYVYYIDSLLAKIFFYTTIAFVAAFLHMLPETICYYWGFSTIRYTAGGFHAKTDKACAIISWITYFSSMIVIMSVSHLMSVTLMMACSLVLLLFSLVIVLGYAPIEHINKPVPPSKKARMKKYCVGFQGIHILITVLFFIQHGYIYAFSLALGDALAALALLIAYYQKGGNVK